MRFRKMVLGLRDLLHSKIGILFFSLSLNHLTIFYLIKPRAEKLNDI